ncbi:amidohydrolase family protein [Clostridium sp. OS1-26]|uniref:amidohydrolase family protein n=1 Tax=Clostridium sp. OS1-26 TaxID=3070681 RepID=UPI0027E09004|nr:amidohydrolase family protein [Clostridium sp. OS1-26]WML37146.1 amidohydrolase family protein [Clostridium sp. OS1-26]
MYKNLREIIDNIKIIDDHGHPGFAEFFEGIPQEKRVAFAVDTFKTPKEISNGFPYLEQLHYEAYEKFYGFSKEDIDNTENMEKLQIKYDERRKDLNKLMDKVMEEAGVEALIANYVIPDKIKNKDSIKFIPSIDGLVFPFDNTYLKERTLGKSFIGSYEYLLEKLKQKYGYEEKGYENYIKFIHRVLEGYVKEGVVGFKFSIAYARSTYFENINLKCGEELYQKAKAGNISAYNKLQDLMVWTIMRKILELDMPVQFHFAITDNYVNYFDPLNLSNILEDEELKNSKIVILHGGYPRFTNAETLALGGLTPNNVYIDFSGRIMFANHPKIIAKMLRTWLEKPVLWNKLLYGSDLLWGERYLYTCAKAARYAVYLALESMIDDEIINEETAIVIAKKILRENSKQLYKL